MRNAVARKRSRSKSPITGKKDRSSKTRRRSRSRSRERNDKRSRDKEHDKRSVKKEPVSTVKEEEPEKEEELHDNLLNGREKKEPLSLEELLAKKQAEEEARSKVIEFRSRVVNVRLSIHIIIIIIIP